MGKRYGCLVLLAMFCCSLASAEEKIAVLVPGFFNLPGQKANVGLPYFSTTIVETVRASGYTPVVINDLNPVGSLLENGERVRQELTEIAARYPGAQLTVIAHSAGGLYTGHALTLQPDLPIANVVTISTPYAGVELIELLKWIPGFKTITNVLNLAALQEFESSAMAKTLAQIRIPQRVRWIALSAAQPACGVLNCAEAQYQSWLLSFAWRFSKKTGDGVVAVDSALAKSVTIASFDGQPKKIETWDGFVVPLEHWETVLDAKFFTLIGVVNTGWIDQQQRAVYSKILSQL
jgi:hypothetical protein